MSSPAQTSRIPSILGLPAGPSIATSTTPAAGPMIKAAGLLRPTFAPNDPSRERAARLAESRDPEKYIREVFGWKLARDQIKGVHAYLENTEILFVGANGTGKSVLAHILALGWSWDAIGSQEVDGACRGGILLLIAPTGNAILKAYQKHFMGLGRVAAANGHTLPGWGQHSERSASWIAQEGHWYIEGLTVAKEAKSGDGVSHAALGVHHDNMVIVYDEIKAISSGVVEAGKGRLRGQFNKAVGSTNPTSAGGLGYKLSQIDGWKTVYSSAVGRTGYSTRGGRAVDDLLPHENIEQRRPVFKGAVSHLRVEEDLRNKQHFQIRGELFQGKGDPPSGFAKLEAKAGDFPYALPGVRLTDEVGPRADGFPGHPRAPVQVIRPLTGTAYGRIIGGWPPLDPRSLFSDFSLLRAVELRDSLKMPEEPPRVVGVDASVSDKGDEMIGVPWWGPPARELIQLAWEARPSDGSSIQAGADALIEAHIESTLGNIPAIVGESEPLPVDENGAAAARLLVDKWGTTPIYQVDHGSGAGVGSSLMALGCEVMWMHFGGAALQVLPGQVRAAWNARAMWAFDLADCVDLGLVGMFRDEQGRADLVAMGAPVEMQAAAARRLGVGGKIEVFKIRPKDEIKKYLGRSPDRGDGVLLASAKPPVGVWE